MVAFPGSEGSRPHPAARTVQGSVTGAGEWERAWPRHTLSPVEMNRIQWDGCRGRPERLDRGQNGTSSRGRSSECEACEGGAGFDAYLCFGVSCKTDAVFQDSHLISFSTGNTQAVSLTCSPRHRQSSSSKLAAPQRVHPRRPARQAPACPPEPVPRPTWLPHVGPCPSGSWPSWR